MKLLVGEHNYYVLNLLDSEKKNLDVLYHGLYDLFLSQIYIILKQSNYFTILDLKVQMNGILFPHKLKRLSRFLHKLKKVFYERT